MNERGKGYRVVLIVIVILFVFPVGFYWYFEHLRQIGAAKVIALPFLSQDSIPAFKFIAHNGDTVTRDSIRNNMVVANFFYTTCPGICTKLSESMEKVQDYVRKNDGWATKVRLLSFSVDPVNDTVGKLKIYAKEHHADDRIWWLMTGNKKELYDLAIGFFKLPTIDVTNDSTGAKEPFVHSERLVLLDKKGMIRGYYDGTDSIKVRQLLNDMINLDISYAIQQGIDEKRISKMKSKAQ